MAKRYQCNLIKSHPVGDQVWIVFHDGQAFKAFTYPDVPNKIYHGMCDHGLDCPLFTETVAAEYKRLRIEVRPDFHLIENNSPLYRGILRAINRARKAA